MESLKCPDKQAVTQLLIKAKIPFEISEHEPFLTCAPAIEHFKLAPPNNVAQPFNYAKNLFLKNKAGGFCLLTAANETKVDYKTLCKIFKTKNGNIREGPKEKLLEFLHCEPGHVNAFATLNMTDEQKKECCYYLDKNLLDKYKSVGAPPMNAAYTCWVKVEDLTKLLEDNGVKVNVLDLSGEEQGEEKEKNEIEKKDETKPKKEKKEKKEKQGESVAEKDGKKPEKKEKKEKKPKEAKDAKDKKDDDDMACQGIQNKKSENFSDWYSEVITKSEMIEYYDISGCYILRPWSYEIWEAIQRYFDEKIKKIGVKNCSFPLFVSQKALFKEKEHVEGFSPEVAWVTKSGKSDIEPPIAIRPTSETIMYPAYAKWIRSHRDLPLLLNQWTNIVRWEFKNPTPFIRTREFLWQEGHTAHATFQDAEDLVYVILDFYRLVYEDLMACPVIPGKKSENEKFPGGLYTTSIETLLPNGKGCQCATSHHLGQNFSKMFEITYLDKEKNKQHAWQTSWGLTTRTIGVLVMMHSDDKGLVLPPRVAPIEVVIVPIKTSKDNSDEIIGHGAQLLAELTAAGVKAKLDADDLHTPGWKFAQWELKGVPVRIEYGKKDLSKGQVTFFCRDNFEKFAVQHADVVGKVKETLATIQKRMFQKQKDRMAASKTVAENFEQFLEGMSRRNLIYTQWCEDSACEDEVKAKFKKVAAESEIEDAVGTCKTFNVPNDQSEFRKGSKCFNCGKEAKCVCIWGRTY